MSWFKGGSSCSDASRFRPPFQMNPTRQAKHEQGDELRHQPVARLGGEPRLEREKRNPAPQRGAGLAAQFGATGVRHSLTTFSRYPAVLVTYRLPPLLGKPAEYGAEAFVHGPFSTPLITVTTTNAKDAKAIMRQIAGTITFS